MPKFTWYSIGVYIITTGTRYPNGSYTITTGTWYSTGIYIITTGTWYSTGVYIITTGTWFSICLLVLCQHFKRHILINKSYFELRYKTYLESKFGIDNTFADRPKKLQRAKRFDEDNLEDCSCPTLCFMSRISCHHNNILLNVARRVLYCALQNS